MDEPFTIAEAPLGHPFTPYQLERDCRVVVGAVSWPDKRPGCGLVLAVTGDKRLRATQMHLLDESQSDDLNELVRNCNRMDGTYLPSRWVGDNENQAALRIVQELAVLVQGDVVDGERRVFRCVCPTPIVEMEGMYAYLMPLLKRVLHRETRSLWLKTSLITGYLGEIKPDEIGGMKRGEYPAIEALGFAVREALDWVRQAQRSRPDPRDATRATVRNHPMAF